MNMLKYFYFYWFIKFEIIYSLANFRLYKTSISDRDKLEYDCLYYYVLDDIVYFSGNGIRDHQTIPYCFRPLNKSIDFIQKEGFGNKITFETLRRLNVTSQNLLSWSSVIDVIENYQLYLDDYINQNNLSNEIFFNCSYGWFGLNCEYTFFSEYSFDRIVWATFHEKTNTINSALNLLTNYTCYTYLNCNRGPKPICLDWREICDGHIDCLNNGIDEENCFLLEIHECQQNEYRCLNGQCIPESFFNDNEKNPDCLDKSDESRSAIYTNTCPWDPSFRCEETKCTNILEFTCGDGHCLLDFNRLPSNIEQSCNNHRKYFIDKILFSYNENSHLSYECWSLMICLLNLNFYFEYIFCEFININQINKYCPNKFLFPLYPILFGHVYFAFQNTRLLNENQFSRPDYICFNQTYCPYLSTSIIIQNRTCQLVNYTDLFSSSTWYPILRPCLSNLQLTNRTYCQQMNMYECQGEYKCISKHRLVDYMIDCYEQDDEIFNQSCFLNQKFRLQCSIKQDKCVSPWLINSFHYDCPASYNSDKIFDKDNQQIYFSMICDGFEDIHQRDYLSLNETDETHCEYWPCNNQYTRCDGFLNCIDGSDEMNCSILLCPINTYACISSQTYNMTCISSNQFHNGIIDCLGGIDEYKFCRELFDLTRLNAFQCQNSTICLSGLYLCDNEINCPMFKDDEQICQFSKKFPAQFSCEANFKTLFTIEENLQCQQYINKYPKSSFQLETMISKSNLIQSEKIESILLPSMKYNVRQQWLCNRGILIYYSIDEIELCLCPPSYFGLRCQYQNQRVSLTIQIQTGQIRIPFQLLILLIDNQTNEIHSYEQYQFLSIRDCRSKFHLNLLYKTRPKEYLNYTYFIRIEIFNQLTLKHHSTWLYSLEFLFLPVQRLAILLEINNEFEINNCTLNCHYGQCRKYANRMEYYCQCDSFYSGKFCTKKLNCLCSIDSLCIHSICICSLNKFGRQCRLNYKSCQENICLNNGTCISTDERISEKNFTCICDQIHSGLYCERNQSEIMISFERNFPIPSSIFIHFIQIRSNMNPIQTISLQKISFAKDTTSIYRSELFNLIFIQISNFYYLSLIENNFNLSTNYFAQVFTSNRCRLITELLNKSLVELSFLHRIKYYHLPCQKQIDLNCFYDDIYMCLCNSYRHANCFPFERKIDLNCKGLDYCSNNGSCFQNDPICPNKILCSCPECYHGSQCQLNTYTFILSLDVILAYHIHADIKFFQQSLPVLISAFLTIFLSIIGLISSILSIITFRSKILRKFGTGIYLYINSIDCLCIMIFLNLKYWFLIIFQMNLITNQIILFSHCLIIEFLFKSLFSINDWLNVCVAIERTISTIQGVRFNKIQSQKYARWIIFFVYIFIPITYLHDPIHRKLIPDKDENRIWCFVDYSTNWLVYNFVMSSIHVIGPFLCNILSAFIIIIKLSRQRLRLQKKQNFRQHFIEQFHQHKHLIISPLILIFLVLPRLIISFLSGCMKSARNPWLFLFSYYLSFISPSLIFLIFILPSDTFRKEFYKQLSK